MGVVLITTVPALAQVPDSLLVGSFVTFESGPVRPVAMSPDGMQLFVVNTPDNRLEIFDVTATGITHVDAVPVGMEPVAVAARTNSEVWVVNHLSDSVSIVDLSASPPRVSRTLIVGDEPRDIVFAGTGGDRAFISTAHRGQHRTHPSLAAVPGAGDPQLTTAGIGRADLWVFDATSLGNTLGGRPIEIMSFFADTPRALATSPTGDTVYLAAFHSGNQTTTVSAVCDGFASAGPCGTGGGDIAPGGNPGPSDNVFGEAAPETGLIVKFNPDAGPRGVWQDELSRDWNSIVKFNLPDNDVFALNANTLDAGQVFSSVGTILFNMVVNPQTGKLYVTNTESPNHVRFEGPGNHGNSTVQGHLSESRITVIDPSVPSVDPQHLNQHIDYTKLHTDPNDTVDPDQILHSLATPLQAVVSSDGNTIYMAAFGSAKIGVFTKSQIEDPAFEVSFDPTVASASYIPTGGGPSGLALDETHNRLYVLTRFDNSVSSIPLGAGSVETIALHNPEPDKVVEGRPFLYDAVATSGNGEASCASCHIFGDNDDLAWDLGNPDAPVSANSQPAIIAPAITTLHPMKGPMTTQTLRGMATQGALHWRGDRVDGFFGTDPCTEPFGAPCNEDRAFRNFIVAFEGLVGKDGILAEADMQKFSDFALELMQPPNPVRALSNSRTPSETAGLAAFNGPTHFGVGTCNTCHTLDPSVGFFGSNSILTVGFKAAHLRNAYTKVGMFGMNIGGGIPHQGDQIRGFGFTHDGDFDTLGRFLGTPGFNIDSDQEADLVQFILAFDTDLAPIVGQQATLTSSNSTEVSPRIDLMVARDDAAFVSARLGGSGVTECDLIAKGTVAGEERGWMRQPDGLFLDDTGATISDGALRALVMSEGPITYTAVPPGSATRMGIDRDEDVALDGVDNCPAVANGVQTDTDADLVGDACDPDDDDDGCLDAVDPFPLVFSPDNDGDGLGGDCDNDDVCEAVSAVPSILWPPNHKFVDITVEGVTAPSFTITIDSIFQDENVLGPGQGSGHTAPDGLGVATSTASVRAERDGTGDGRVYHIGFTAEDDQRGSCSATVTVCVPRNKSDSSCGDGGELFDSSTLTLEGIAAGGSVCVDVATDSGQVHHACVVTASGQTGSGVIQALADEINGNASLAAEGVWASAQSGALLIETGGYVANASVADPGLVMVASVPVLPSHAALALMVLLMLATAMLLIQHETHLEVDLSPHD